MKPANTNNSHISFEIYVEDVRDYRSGYGMVFRMGGNLLYMHSTMDSMECVQNNRGASKAGVVRIEKLEERVYRFLKSDSVGMVYHFSERFPDYEMLVRGIDNQSMPISVPDSISNSIPAIQSDVAHPSHQRKGLERCDGGVPGPHLRGTKNFRRGAM